MSLPGHVFTAPGGVRGFNTAGTVTWGVYNLNADQYPAVRGLQMKQSRPKPGDSPTGFDLDFQIDKVSADALGGRPTLLALDGWPELP